MSIAKLAMIALAAVGSFVLALAASRQLLSPLTLVRGRAVGPMPRLTLGAAGLWILCGPAASWSIAPSIVRWIAESGQPELVVTDPTDPWLAHLYAFGLGVMWTALPGAAVVAWLLLSSRRTPVGAWGFGLAVGLGGSLGLAGAVAWSTRAMAAVVGVEPFLAVELRLLDVVALAVRSGMGGCLCGACAAGIGFMAASSRRGLHAALWMASGLPFAASVLAALATPPDLVSHLLVTATMIVMCLVGLGVGLVLRPLVGARREG